MIIKYEFNGFFARHGNSGLNTNIIPCTYEAKNYKNENEIDITITESRAYGIGHSYFVFYVGDPERSLAERINKQFFEIYKISPTEQNIILLLRATKFDDNI